MHYHVETNALILPYKKALPDISGGFSLHRLLSETLPLCYWNLASEYRHFSNNKLFYKYLFRTNCNITSSANKARSNLYIIVICCGLEFQFLSVPTHSILSSQSMRSTFYVPNPPSPLEYDKTTVTKYRHPMLLAAADPRLRPHFHWDRLVG
jgi:hypothetical protein